MEVNNERERYFYPHELAAMQRTAEALARLNGQPRRWLANIILAAPYTGLRRGVFCDLRCRDVHQDEQDELWLRVARDKNGRPVEKRLVGAVQEIVEKRLKEATPGAFLFPGPKGGNAYTSIARYLPIVVNKVGQRHPDWGLRWGAKGGGVTFHSFRHAMASLALNSGVPRDVVKRMGNWKTDRMVNRYAHRSDQHVRDAEERLAEVLHISSQPQQKAETDPKGASAKR
jgi:integrase